MAWVRNSLQTLIARAESRVASKLEIASPLLSRSVSIILARVIAAAGYSIEGYVAYYVRQIHVSMMDEEHFRQTAEDNGFDQLDATFATCVASAPGTDGTTIPAGRVYKTAAGASFATNAEVTIVGGAAQLNLTALVAGSGPRVAPGAVLTIESPIAGASNTATVVSNVDGADQETIEAWKGRYIDHLKSEVLGGHESEYVTWARQVPGVTRAWADPRGAGLGTVVVWFTRDNDLSPIPGPGEIAEVADHIATKRPATADVHVRAPFDTAVPLAIAVANQYRAAIETELKDLFYRKADVTIVRPSKGTITLGDIHSAISRITPAYSLISPVVDVVPIAGGMCTVGPITWSP